MLDAILALICLRGSVQAQALAPVARFPHPNIEQPAQDYLSWAGFAYLPSTGRKVEGSFPAPGDWSGVEAAASQPERSDAVPWRIRIFVLKRIDWVPKLEDGTLYEEQCSLESPDIDRINRSIELLQKIVQAETAGKLKLVPQVTFDSEPLLLGDRTLAQALSDYVYPRANGGKYDAEDHVNRGPYESVLCLHPMPVTEPHYVEVNGMPTADLSVYGPLGYEVDGQLALAMADCWMNSVKSRARGSGVLGSMRTIAAIHPLTGLENPNRYTPNEDWAAIVAGPDLAAADINARLHLDYAASAEKVEQPDKIVTRGFKGPSSEVRVGSDITRGSILTYSEKGEARNGGLSFPVSSDPGSDILPSKTPTLSLWAKSDSKDPLALECATNDGRTFDVSLGPDLPGDAKTYQANFQRDGEWHQLKIDLKQTGFDAISHLRLVPTSNSRRHPKITLGPIDYEFASIQATTDPADGPLADSVPDPNSPDARARARWAHSAKPSPQLLALLKDPDWFVRLNAIQAYIAQPDPGAEQSLKEDATLSIDGPVAAAALDALWKLATPTAVAVVNQTILTGVTEQGKAEAARLLCASKDGSVAANLIVLQQSRGLATRLAVVNALGTLPGENAAKIRTTFLWQEDPEIRLQVTRTSDPNDPYQRQKLLWSAVNEGSDAVRVEADEKLIQSEDASARSGGYAGIKDDSLEVRVQLLRYLEAHPNETNRDALRQAVADRSPRVKAAAIRAFASLDKGVKPEELGGAIQDTHPVIQLALLELVKSKKIVLPDDVLKQMSESGDPEVAASLKSLSP